MVINHIEYLGAPQVSKLCVSSAESDVNEIQGPLPERRGMCDKVGQLSARHGIPPMVGQLPERRGIPPMVGPPPERRGIPPMVVQLP